MLVLAISPAALDYGRSYYGAVLFLIIAFSMSLPNYKVNIRFSPIYSVLYVILVCTFFMNVMVGVSDVFLSKLDLTKQYSYLVEQEKKGNINPVFPDISYSNTTKYSAYSNHLSHVKLIQMHKLIVLLQNITAWSLCEVFQKKIGTIYIEMVTQS